jgi:hopene-associated glycosyltransferase HpnB
MIPALTTIAALACAAWMYLFFLHGRFWRVDQRLPAAVQAPRRWPTVTAIIPARNEEAFIGDAVGSLLRQDYPGVFAVIVIDDSSEDATVAAARKALSASGAARGLTILRAPPLAEGWTGKLWAVRAGIAAAAAESEMFLLSDADIAHPPDTLRRLVAHGASGRYDLVSLMVRLRCASAAEQLLIPSFVYFFQKLYPFRWVNDAARRTAAAAGGCMLVRRAALERIGGIAAIRDALIDDCALAQAIKRHGPIWLGHADGSTSLRRYDRVGEIWRMVARTAFTQLRHSHTLLLATVVGMLLLYAIPPVATVLAASSGAWPACALGGLGMVLMLASYWPTWRSYRPLQWQFVLMPLSGWLYTLMTIDSAFRHWRGHGGGWKGRTYSTAGPGFGARSQSPR